MLSLGKQRRHCLSFPAYRELWKWSLAETPPREAIMKREHIHPKDLLIGVGVGGAVL